MNVLILAGERPGGDPLALAEGVANKTDIVIAGKTMLAHVLDAVMPLVPLTNIFISGNAVKVPVGVQVIATANTPCASVIAALSRVEFPVLLTTADHPLLSAPLIHSFLEQAAILQGDVCVGMVPLTVVQQHYPRNRRTKLRFREGSFSGANLFLLRNQQAMGVIDFWRQMEAVRKSPWRMVQVLGLASIVRYALGMLRLEDVVAVLARRTGARVAPVMLLNPHAAIDVDRADDLLLVREIMAARDVSSAVEKER